MADNKPRKDPDVFSDSKLKLYAKPLADGARSPSLRVKMIENNPCIEVDLGIKTEGKNGRDGYPIKIESPMEPKTFRMLMNLIIRTAAYPNVCAMEMENWGHPFIWDRDAGKNVRSKDRLIVSRFSIAKREDGMVVLGVTAKGKKDVEFEFLPNEFHPLMQNGQPLEVKMSSPMAATAWAEIWKDLFNQHFTSNWVEPEFQKKRRLENIQRANGGGSGGGNNYSNQQQRPQQQQSAPSANIGSGFDDGEDIPF